MKGMGYGVGAFVLAGWVAVGAAGGQEAGQPTFRETVAVDLVNLEVRVTDRKGNPITDLKQGDFEVFIDGQPVEIATFDRWDGTFGEAAEPSKEDAASPQVAPGEDNWFALYLDMTNINPGARERLVTGLAELIAGPLTRSAKTLVLVDDGKLTVAQPFTASRADLEAVLEKVRTWPASTGALQLREHRRVYESIAATYRQFQGGRRVDGPLPCEDGMELMLQQATDRAQAITARVDRVLGGLDWASNSLAGLPGRRVLIYAGDGLETQPGLELYTFIAGLCPLEETNDISRYYTAFDRMRPMQNLVSRINARGVTMYALETGGLVADANADAFESFLRPSLAVTQIERANRQSGLFLLARDTGGKAVLNANQFQAPLAELRRDWASYYQLGLQVKLRGDGLDHRLGVRVKGKPHDVRYRTGYADRSPLERLEQELFSRLVLGTEANPLGAALAFDAVAAANGDSRLKVTVPLEALTLARQEGGRGGEVRLVLAVRDASGHWQSPRQKIVPVRLALPAEGADATPAGTHDFVIEVPLAAGEYLAAVAVRDEIGGGVSYLRGTIAVAAP